MVKAQFLGLLAAAVATLGGGAKLQAQTIEGRAAFAPCAACHSTRPNERRLGPSLAAIVGRKAGAQRGFPYSPAMAKSNVTWSRSELDAFLKTPRLRIPGNQMAYGGIADPARRSAIIAYLATLR
jgi:cytochrome c